MVHKWRAWMLYGIDLPAKVEGVLPVTGIVFIFPPSPQTISSLKSLYTIPEAAEPRVRISSTLWLAPVKVTLYNLFGDVVITKAVSAVNAVEKGKKTWFIDYSVSPKESIDGQRRLGRAFTYRIHDL